MSTRNVRIYHHPRCTKSRQALALLQGRGVEPEVILYLEVGLAPTELRELIRKLGVRPHDLLRTKEEAYLAAQLGPSSSEDQIFAALVEAPILLERPIVITEKGAVIGRPPEKVLEIL